MSDLPECVISELLCYIQCKMSSMEHDAIVKSVTYAEDDIDNAKKLMFEKCKESKSATRITEMISQSSTVRTSSISLMKLV